MAPNHNTNEALCKNSQARPSGPVSASMTPVPITATDVSTTTGPSRRSSGAGGPLRRYPAAPRVIAHEPVDGRAGLERDRADQQHAEEEVQREQPADGQDGYAFGREQHQQHQAGQRGEPLIPLGASGGVAPMLCRPVPAARVVRRCLLAVPAASQRHARLAPHHDHGRDTPARSSGPTPGASPAHTRRLCRASQSGQGNSKTKPRFTQQAGAAEAEGGTARGPRPRALPGRLPFEAWLPAQASPPTRPAPLVSGSASTGAPHRLISSSSGWGWTWSLSMAHAIRRQMSPTMT